MWLAIRDGAITLGVSLHEAGVSNQRSNAKVKH